MTESVESREIERPLWVLVSLAGLAIVLYFQALDYPFHYDDHHSVQYNPHIRSLSNIPSFFVDPSKFSSDPSGFMYRPVLLTTYALNYVVSGQQVFGYRVVNLFLHVLASFAVCLIARRLLASRGIAIGAGFLFLCHPMHSEVVHYISSRSGLLAAVCFLLGFGALISTDKEPRRRGVMGALAYGIGLLAKSITITLPFLLVVRDFCLSGARRAVSRVGHYWYLWLSAGLYLAVIKANGFLGRSLESRPRPFMMQLWTQLKALVYYIKLMLFPVNGSIEHQFAVSATIWDSTVLVAFALLVSITIVAARISRRILLFFWAWFIITLAPASVMPLNILVSERRMYLASAGLLLAICWTWQQPSFTRIVAFRRRGVNAIGIGVLILFCALNLQRNRVWVDDVILWQDAAAKAPSMHRVRLNLGLAHKRDGRVDDALRELEHGLRLKPDHADAWNEVGNLHKSVGDLELAEDAYRAALDHNSSFPGVYYNLGNLKQGAGDLAEAVRYFERALELDAHFVLARNNLGQAFEAAGRYEEAARQYELAVRDFFHWKSERDPELGGAWFNLAVLRERFGDVEGAKAAFVRAHDLLNEHEEYARFSARAADAVERLAVGQAGARVR